MIQEGKSRFDFCHPHIRRLPKYKVFGYDFKRNNHGNRKQASKRRSTAQCFEGIVRQSRLLFRRTPAPNTMLLNLNLLVLKFLSIKKYIDIEPNEFKIKSKNNIDHFSHNFMANPIGRCFFGQSEKQEGSRCLQLTDCHNNFFFDKLHFCQLQSSLFSSASFAAI